MQSADMSRPPAAPQRDPQWIAHRYEEGRDAVHFVQVPRAEHGGFPFLTDEYMGDRAVAAGLRSEAAGGAPAPAPLHFLFHSAFCCSTLLVRAMDRPGMAMGLSEPTILNDIVGWRHRARPQGPQVAAVLRDALRLLARPWGPGEAVVVKPSNLLNPMATAMLQLTPGARAILLHAPLEDFLGSIARKGMWGRLWVRDLLVKLLREGAVQLGIEGEELLKLTDLQAAAVGWLAQQALFARLAGQMPERIRTLDSVELLARPAESVAAAALHYGLTIDADTAHQIAAGPAFTRNSKTGADFTASDRAAERAQGLSLHADEIAMVLKWAETVAQQFAVPMRLPAPLLPPA